MPSWIGPWEIAIILVLILLILGPKKLPELGKSLGKSIRGFKTGMKETQDEVKTAVSEVRTAAEKRDAEPLKTEAKDPSPESEKAKKTE
jgi:sec-independent protein translocase protein TatA